MNKYTCNFYTVKGGFKSECLSVPDEIVVDRGYADSRRALAVLRRDMMSRAQAGKYEGKLARLRAELEQSI